MIFYLNLISDKYKDKRMLKGERIFQQYEQGMKASLSHPAYPVILSNIMFKPS